LISGEPCDVIVLTASMIGDLTHEGWIQAGSSAPIGRVGTAVAVRAGEPLPAMADTESFRDGLVAAKGIYFPDPERATAGIHFVNVLGKLGIHQQVEARLKPFPSGAAAMLHLARSTAPGLLGCTQITEIHYTDGVSLVGPFPPAFQLATVYSAAVCRNAPDPERAHRLVALLTGPGSEAMRLTGGFEL
jgi:molybdate transport system substrate-binding protein